MRHSRFWDTVVLVLGLIAAAGIFYFFFCLFLQAVTAAEPREVPAEVYAAAVEAEEAETVGIVVYVEGDGPAPEWYQPDGEMLVEWYAEEPEKGGFGFNGEPDGENPEVVTTDDYILDVPLDADLQAYIWTLCEDAGVPFTLVIAVIEAESTYRADVISASGDWGLMQINRVCHEWLRSELGIEDFLDPRDNVRAGVYILAGYYRQYGAVSGTLVAYNQGQQSAEELFAAGVYETAYSKRVMSIMLRLEREGR